MIFHGWVFFRGISITLAVICQWKVFNLFNIVNKQLCTQAHNEQNKKLLFPTNKIVVIGISISITFWE